MKIEAVCERDLGDLLPMLVAYCDFYDADPGEENLRAFALTLMERPDEGVQLIARGEDGAPLGFASVFWTWQTLGAARVGVMNDLFVAPGGRGSGAADALIAACLERCRSHGAALLAWKTAPDNHRAQAVYDRVGARRSQWLDYDLPVQQEEKAQ